jgi:hypothetical protein
MRDEFEFDGKISSGDLDEDELLELEGETEEETDEEEGGDDDEDEE